MLGKTRYKVWGCLSGIFTINSEKITYILWPSQVQTLLPTLYYLFNSCSKHCSLNFYTVWSMSIFIFMQPLSHGSTMKNRHFLWSIWFVSLLIWNYSNKHYHFSNCCCCFWLGVVWNLWVSRLCSFLQLAVHAHDPSL